MGEALNKLRHTGFALAETEVTLEQATKYAKEFCELEYPKNMHRREWAVSNIILFYNSRTEQNNIWKRGRS